MDGGKTYSFGFVHDDDFPNADNCAPPFLAILAITDVIPLDNL